MSSFTRGVGAFMGASLLGAVGFPAVILAIVTPAALLVATLHEALTWLAGSTGLTGPFLDGLVAFTSAVGGILLFALIARGLLRLWWTYSLLRTRRARRVSALSPQWSVSDTHLAPQPLPQR
jgi:chromate transport protein ChrA